MDIGERLDYYRWRWLFFFWLFLMMMMLLDRFEGLRSLGVEFFFFCFFLIFYLGKGGELEINDHRGERGGREEEGKEGGGGGKGGGGRREGGGERGRGVLNTGL